MMAARERNYFVKALSVLFDFYTFAAILFGFGYRWALKSTAVVWVLLIFFTHSIFRARDNLGWRLADLIEVPWSTVERLWAAVIIVVHLILPLFFWQWYGPLTQGWLVSAPQVHDFIEYLVVTALPLKAWHIAGAIGGLLTWTMWVLAHSWRIAMNHDGMSAQEQHVALRSIQTMMFVRALLLTYTVVCGLIAVIKTLHWVSFEVRWLP
jgi:hypothetical protein